MSEDEDFSYEIEGEITPEKIKAKSREYEAMTRRQYEKAMARLEAPDIEPTHRAAYEATLPEMAALSLSEISWPNNDPRYDLHHAMQYGDKLSARREEIEQRFEGRLPLEQMFTIKRYALAALHAFKLWRSNPEPEQSFEKLLRDAAAARYTLRAQVTVLVGHGLIRLKDLRHYDGGATPESVACDLFLLTGVLKDTAPRLNFELLTTPVELMEAELVGKSLLRHATGQHYPQLWQPTLQYARAFTLVDRASFYAELALSELHNEERDPARDGPWTPGCLFCACSIVRQRHHRHQESPKEARERAQFVSSTMTATLRQDVVKN